MERSYYKCRKGLQTPNKLGKTVKLTIDMNPLYFALNRLTNEFDRIKNV